MQPDNGRWTGPFRQRGLEALLNERHEQVSSVETGISVPVFVPALGIGQSMLAHMAVREVFPAPADYRSRTPWLCVFRGVTVHGRTGIVRLDDCVVEDMLAWSAKGTHYKPRGADILLSRGAARRRLAGAAISLLGISGADNYYHWTVDGIGRLSALDADTLARCRHVLVPPLRTDFQRAAITLAGLSGKTIIEVADGEKLQIEELIWPWAAMEDYRPHPCLRDFFRRMADVPAAAGRGPRLVYVDRRNSGNRRLVNEDEVVSGLERMGFVPVRLEQLTLMQQVTLFRQATCIVAPHGAGLANLLFAPTGCRVVELQMDHYVHWCFRVIAALGGLPYDCVIGRQLPTRAGTIHAQQWAVPVMHVMAAVEVALQAGPANRPKAAKARPKPG